MFYGDGVMADQYFLDDEPEDLLAIHDVKAFCGLTNTGQKVADAPDKLKVHFLIDHPGFDRLQFRRQGGISFAQPGNAIPELRKLDEPFLVRIEQAVDAVLDAGDLMDERLFPCLCRIGVSGLLNPSVYLVADEVGIFK
jgi:hypothetical protein